MVMVTANMKVTPWTTTKSRAKIAVTIIRPMPGQAKTVSTIPLPPKAKPNCRPRIVMTGIMAHFRACTHITTRSLSPLARAVRIKSSLSTSSILDLMSLAERAAIPVPTVRAGSIKWRSVPKPNTGSHLSCKPKSSISNRASQKLGIDNPSKEPKRAAESAMVFCLVAARMPAGKAITIATTIEASASCMVAPKALRNIVATGSPVCIDSPKSPRNMFLTQIMYRTCVG
ncbi:MAG: hypothetical protein DDT39_01411 [Firmicutes bacterium]|nr:hypothetical protein [candidate division NPL-UPA2 bacterium]